MVFCHGSRQQVDPARLAVMLAGSHPRLDITSPVSDHPANRKDNIEVPAALRDVPHVGQVATRIAGLQVTVTHIAVARSAMRPAITLWMTACWILACADVSIRYSCRGPTEMVTAGPCA